MKKQRPRALFPLLALVVVVFATLPLYAQVDSVKFKSDLQKLDSIRNRKLSVVDSAEQKIGNASEKILKINQKLTGYDTLTQKQQALQTLVDKHKKHLEAKLDSMKAKGLPYDHYTQKLDSLNRIDPLTAQQQKLEGKLQEGEGKITAEKSKLNEGQSKLNEGQSKIQQLEEKPVKGVNEKLDQLSKESLGKGTLPQNASAPGLPDAKLPNTTLDLPKADVPALDKPSLNVDANIPKPDVNLDSKLGNVTKDIKAPSELEKVNDLQSKVGENVGDVTQKAGEYGKDVKHLGNGDIDKVKGLNQEALSKAGLDNEMKELNGGTKMMEEQKAMLNQFKNQDEYKKKMMARGKEMAMKQMAAYSAQLQQTVNKVTAYQKQAGTVLAHKKDLPKRRDPLKQLKFYEKFVPGITLQTFKPGAFLVDVDPTLRYRLTSYWSVGAGWNERVTFGKSVQPQEQLRVFGARAFSEVIIFKGLAMRIDGERMNAYIAPDLRQQDAGARRWVWQYMAGLKKEFTFLPRVTGNVQFMYNLYDPYRYRVYPARFNVRFGFEVPMKKHNRKRK